MTPRAGVAALVAVALAACGPAPAPRGPAVIENRFVGEPGSAPTIPAYAVGPITEASLQAFMARRFAPQLADGTFVADYSGTTEDLLDELHTMGVHDLAELAALIPDDFERRGAGEFVTEDPANIPGLVRDFLMIHDAHRYFGQAWKNRWQSILPANVSALKAYVRDFQPFYDAQVLTPDEVRDAPAPPTSPHRGGRGAAPARP